LDPPVLFVNYYLDLFLCCGPNHAPAFFCTKAAGFSAFPAMFHMAVLFTLLTAGKTDIGAYAANIFGIFSVYAHYLGGGIANSSTFHIELDTAYHHLNIFFLEAGRGAMVAKGSATQTRVNAGLEPLIMCHNYHFWL
jgi:uncharacterized membrane protein (DUF4010 family)